MKVIISVLVVLLLNTSIVSAQQTTAPAGSGTKVDPYRIETLNNLFWVAENVNGWYNFFEGKYLQQTANIDASVTSSWNSGQGWKPIGDSLNFHFKGTYDGGGYTISNLFINRPNTNCNGLFGYAELGRITNLRLTDVSIVGQHGTAALIGISLVPITRCSASGTVRAGKYTAGLVSVNKGTIDTCFSSCTVVGTEESGGLVGVSTGSINQSFCTGAVSGNVRIGGFVGANGATISDCYATGNVTRLSGATSVSFFNFVGYSTYNCYNCYATGKVLYDGATAPINRGFGSYCSNSFYDKETSLQSTGGCGTASTTLAMTTARTFALAGWDFKGDGVKSIWNIGNGRNNGYPYFNWQYPNDVASVLNVEPLVGTVTATYSGGDTLRATASISRLGSPAATEYGFCWSLSNNPTIADNRVSNGKPTSTGSFSSQINGLQFGTTYYIRAYSISAIDTVYSSSSRSVQTYSVPAGQGTATDPYQIASVGDLFWIVKQVNDNCTTFLGKYFKQTANIDATEVAAWNNGYGWISIGTSNCRFSGTYNGNKHEINNLTGLALFGYTTGASIKNLTMNNCTIKGSNYSACLVGYLSNGSSVDSCNAQGSVVSASGGNYCGGLIGYAYESSIANSSFAGTVNGQQSVGGLIGSMMNSKLNVYRCRADATVAGTTYVGGLVGDQGSGAGLIMQSSSSGSVGGTSSVGGLVGFSSSLSDCYSRSTVTRISGTATTFGALVGSLGYGDVKNSYATGKVIFSSGINPTDHGICGSYRTASAGSKNVTTFWDVETSQQATDNSPAIGKTSAQMKDVLTFVAVGWDFVSLGKSGIWNIGNTRNDGYPYLSWQNPTDKLGVVAVTPVVSAPIVKRIASGTASIALIATSKGLPAATQYGVCWNTTGAPTTLNNKTELGAITSFDTLTTSISGLVENTFYYVRTYATNVNGTYYSPEVTLVYVPGFAGSGNSANPYLINTIYDLFWLEQQCNIHDSVYLKCYFKQTANIDLSITAKLNNGCGWESITRFRGYYDGSFHTIDGLYINRPNQSNQGLWGDLGMYGKIRNLGVTNANVTAGNTVGALVGMARFDSIVNCYATGQVRGNCEVGGLIGYLHYTVAQWSYSSVDVWGNEGVGCFSGRNFNTSNVVNNCYSRGTVTRIGGNAINVAGFVGETVGAYKNCYSTSLVKYANAAGLPTNKGFVGRGSFYPPITSYFDTQTSAQLTDSMNMASGRSTAVMKQQGNYISWNFSAASPPNWLINTSRNDGYPYFWWQSFAATPEVKTNAPTSVSETSITANGQLVAVGGSAITAYGFCWSTIANPTVANNTLNLGTTTTLGAFSATITTLSACTSYYVRAFATNSEGTTYGAAYAVNLLDTQKPSISWNEGVQYLSKNAVLPQFTARATATDNCDAAKLTLTQRPASNTIITSFPLVVTITATDAAGNEAQTSLTVQEAVDTQRVYLNPGWNMMSLYVHPQDSSIETLFAGTEVVEVKNSGSYWRKNQIADFNTLTHLTVGVGYMVKMQVKDTLLVTGSLHTAVVAPIAPTTNWQFIAVPVNPIVDLKPYIATGSEWEAKNLDGIWSATGTNVPPIQPGSAFYIWLKK